MSIERLRALEKAVELVEKATPGAWAQEHRRGSDSSYRTEVFDEHGEAIATLTWHAKPPSYENGLKTTSTDRAENAEAIVAAVNFIREHGSALIAELGQEVGAVPNGKLVGWWNGITPGFDGMGVPSVRWGADAENSRHDIPLYDGYNPIHYVTPPSSPAHTSEARDAARYLALKTHFQAKFHRATCDYWVIVGEPKTDPRFIGEDGEQLTLDNALDAAIAAMRQEAE